MPPRSGVAPIRASKVRYYTDPRLMARILPPPVPPEAGECRPDDWTALERPGDLSGEKVETAVHDEIVDASDGEEDDSDANSGIRQEPAMPDHENIVSEARPDVSEFDFATEEREDDPVRERKAIDGAMRRGARLASQDPDDGIEL